ncbi:MAG TPA: four helix bundle protein [Gemmatimonadaceae bacterium]|nr:four helix bundle protein [Gemmatimonadaceae bacterium]
MSTVQSYRDLRVWQKAMDLAQVCYALCARLPTRERFVLSHQLRRSAISVPANIAEGHSRGGPREYLRVLSIARGSLAELECQLELIERHCLLAVYELEEARACADSVSRMMQRLEQSLRKRLLEPVKSR